MQTRFPYQRHAAQIAFLCLVTAFQSAAADDCRPLWTGTWFTARVEHFGPNDRFAMRGVSQRGLHLTGQCAYFQIEGQRPRVAVIEGTDAKSCGFWPDVISQVKDERTGKWETIAEPFNHGHRKTIHIEPGELNEELFVTLDVFLPFVGKHKLGRLMLKSGEIATFDLSKLLENDQEVIEKKNE